MKDPHALYYDGKLVAIVVEPDAYPGGIADICDRLSPDEGLADAVTIPHNMGNLGEWQKFAQAVTALEVAETITPTACEDDDDC